MLLRFLCLAWALVLGLAACSGVPSRSGQPAATPQPGAAGLQLPFPQRESSGLTEYVLPGSQAEVLSSGAQAQGTALQLPASSGFEFALYRFNTGAEAPDSVAVLLEPGSTSAAWIGLANYDLGHWEFDGPFRSMKTLSCDDPAYTSPAGNIWIAVVTHAQESALVNALSVRTIAPANQPPAADLQADVTAGTAPLTVQFDAGASSDPDSTIIEYAWDFEGDGLYDGFSDSPQVSHVFNAGGSYTARLRVTDDQFARDTASVVVAVNTPPLADLQTDMPKLQPGSSALLMATGSSDSDGFIAGYAWDLDGDGLFGEPGSEAEAQDSPTALLLAGSTPGAQLPAVRVTDDAGAQATAQLTVLVTGWLVVTIANSMNDGSASALAQVAGKPGLAYVYDNSVYFAASSAADGSFGWSSQQASSDFITFQGAVALAQVNGRPGISYVDGATHSVDFAYSTAPDGSGGWGSVQVFGGFVNSDCRCSLALINGKPGVSFPGGLSNTLHFAYSSESDGSGGWSSVEVSPDFVSSDSATSLAQINGRPAISYENGATNTMHFAYSSEPDGSSGWNRLEVTPDFVFDLHPSLAQVNGRPGIAYVDVVGNALRFAYSDLADGSSGWHVSSPLCPEFASGDSIPSLALINGRPAVSHISGGNRLHFSASNQADGASGWSDSEVSPTSLSEQTPTSLALINGRPAISYVAENQLRYAVLYE
jgi:PKD repeat protein